jgi:hypothetical protein
MAAKIARLTHKIVIQLHLVVESCTICSSRSRQQVRKLLDTPSYARELRKILLSDKSVRRMISDISGRRFC